MIKILTVIGARPQFVKAAVLSRLIRSTKWNNTFSEVLLHTGQHYDENMSDIFFRDMEIPNPDIQLSIGGKSHGAMTGQMLLEIEAALQIEKPDIMLVYGDTNSTLAGALAASKLHIPVAHVEAGLRSYNRRMPEEQNRILTDHIAKWLICPTNTAVLNLSKEGLDGGVHQLGDIMYDATLFYQKKIEFEKSTGINRLAGITPNLPSSFYLATIHRAENTDEAKRLKHIMDALNQLSLPVILPLHPRTKQKLTDFNIKVDDNIQIIQPIGYLEMIDLETKATAIITDSGGVQKEAYFMGKPCITLRDETEWVETVTSGWNTIVGANTDAILNACNNIKLPQSRPSLYGNGDTGERILELLAVSF